MKTKTLVKQLRGEIEAERVLRIQAADRLFDLHNRVNVVISKAALQIMAEDSDIEDIVGKVESELIREFDKTVADIRESVRQ